MRSAAATASSTVVTASPGDTGMPKRRRTACPGTRTGPCAAPAPEGLGCRRGVRSADTRGVPPTRRQRAGPPDAGRPEPGPRRQGRGRRQRSGWPSCCSLAVPGRPGRQPRDVEIRLGRRPLRRGDAETAPSASPTTRPPAAVRTSSSGDRYLFVQHTSATPPDEGWVAFEASTRTTRLRGRIDREAGTLVSACDDRSFPLDGEGLRAYPVSVEDGRVIVDLNADSTTTTDRSLVEQRQEGGLLDLVGAGARESSTATKRAAPCTPPGARRPTPRGRRRERRAAAPCAPRPRAPRPCARRAARPPRPRARRVLLEGLLDLEGVDGVAAALDHVLLRPSNTTCRAGPCGPGRRCAATRRR